MIKQFGLKLVAANFMLAISMVMTAQAAVAADNSSVQTTSTTTSSKSPDAMATLKKVGDNLDNSMKAVSADVHKKIDEGQKNTAKSSKELGKNPTVKSLEKAGDELDNNMKKFGSNVGKRVSAAMPAQNKTKPGEHKKPAIDGAKLQKDASKTLQNAGKAIDQSVKKLKSK